MRVKVTTVSAQYEQVPSDNELAAALQNLIDHCHQLIAVNFISDSSGHGMYTISFQDYHSDDTTYGESSITDDTTCGDSRVQPRLVRANVISLSAANNRLPGNDELAAELQLLIDQCNQIIAVTAVSDGRGSGEYKISFLDYSCAGEPAQSKLFYAKEPATF